MTVSKGKILDDEVITHGYTYCAVRGAANCRACSDPQCNLRLIASD